MRRLGVILSALLLLMVSLVIVGALGLLPPPFPSRAVWRPTVNLFSSESHVEIKHTLPAQAGITIDNPLGKVLVRGMATDQLKITLLKKARAATEKRTAQLLEEIRLEIEITDGANLLTVRLPTTGPQEHVEADLEILTPHKSDLTLRAALGAVQVRELEGDLKIKADLGSVELHGFQGNASLEAALGRIKITDSQFDQQLSALANLGDINIQGRLAENNLIKSSLGSVQLNLQRKDTYILEGRVNFGHISLNVPFSGEQTANTIAGTIGEGPARGKIKVTLDLGSLRLN